MEKIFIQIGPIDSSPSIYFAFHCFRYMHEILSIYIYIYMCVHIIKIIAEIL